METIRNRKPPTSTSPQAPGKQEKKFTMTATAKRMAAYKNLNPQKKQRRNIVFALAILALFCVVAISFGVFDCCSASGDSSKMPAESAPSQQERDILPANVKPTHYRLKLYPDLVTFKFKGVVEVSLKVLQASNSISLNAVELEIGAVVLKTDAGDLSPVSRSVDAAKETTTFVFDKQLEVGKVVRLHMEYVGHHNDKMAGFYRSGYNDAETGEKKFMVVTQHEATDARKSFPCWDEPALKATFDVTLVVPKNLTALSNMNDVSSVDVAGSDLKEVSYATTPIMSTYLVAFAVGELDMIQTQSSDAKKTLVRVFTPRTQGKLGEFALDVAAKTLAFFSDYFGIEYPLPKMDLIAIPDFSAGAMENWGLVTFRTVYLLFDEKSSSAKSRQMIAYIVGHELAHQWFGNLVTMEWWNDLWLNEGFATWAGWLSTDFIFPEWKVWTGFVEGEMQSGLGLDALRSSHPIEVPVKNPAEIHQIFDAISYSKGASVIRMLANFLGTENFRTGVRSYLQKFKYQNAKTLDLWTHLSAASGKNVSELMNTWTQQVGYPVVSATETVVGNDVVLKAKQQRFLSSGNVTADEDKETFFAPLQIITSASLNKPSDQVLSTKEATFVIEGLNATSASTSFFKVNYGHTGFYRTKYDAPLMKKLGQAVLDGKFDSSDRIGLLTDAFATARAGFASTVDALAFLGNFVNEDDYSVANEIASEINSIRSVWWEQPKEVTDKLKALQRRTFSPLAKKLGWEYAEGESHLTSLLRTLVINMAGKGGDSEVIAEAKRRFQLFVGGNESAIHPNIRAVTFSIVLQNGGRAEFDALVKIYRESKVIDQKLATLGTLASASDPALLAEFLKMGLSEDVRPQDIIYVFGGVAANPLGRVLAWNFVKDNWQTLYDRYYTGGMSLLSRVVSSTSESFTSAKMAQDVENFFVGKEVSSISRAIQQSLEKIKISTAWIEREAGPVEQWLKTNFA